MDEILEKLAICCVIHRRQGFNWIDILLHTRYNDVNPTEITPEDQQLARAVYMHWVEDTIHLILTDDSDIFMNEGRMMLLEQRPFEWVFGMSLVQSYKKILLREKKTVDGAEEHVIMNHH